MRAILTGDASFEVECDDLVITLTRYDTGLQIDYTRKNSGEVFQSTLTPIENQEVIQ